MDINSIKKNLELLYGNGITKVNFITESESSFYYSYRTVEGNEVDIRVEKCDGRVYLRSIKFLADADFVMLGRTYLYSNDWVHIDYIY